MGIHSLFRWTAGTVVALSGAALILPAGPAAAATSLNGIFRITPGACSGGAVTGSYIRMILPSGSPSGPFMSNSDSTCSDQSYTLLRPGADGGLRSGGYQSPPRPAFDSKGNALADRITAPANYYGTAFATGSSATDPQTGKAVPPPRVSVSGGRLSADLRAFAVTWNAQNFNQGAPKPDGSYPGNTRAAVGSYNARTGAYTLQWTSQVIGGPFDKFTGLWHLTGTFVPASGAAGSIGAGSSGGGAAAGSGSGGSGAGSSGSGSGAHGGTTSGGVAGQPLSAGGDARSSTAAGGVVQNGSPSAAATGNQPAAAPVASTTTITREHWQLRWWLVAVALAIGLAGIVALFIVTHRLRTEVRK